jgi:hypothetical protein
VKRLIFIPMVLFLILLAACSGQAPTKSATSPVENPTQPPQQVENTQPVAQSIATEVSGVQPVATIEQAIPQPTLAGQASSSRDFSTIHVCDLITAKEIADLDKGSVQSPAQASDLGTTRGCSYAITTSSGNFDLVIVYVEPPDLVQAALDLSSDKGKPVEGLADIAYMQQDPSMNQSHLLAIRNGDVGIEVIGENEAALVEIAKLLLTRLNP